LRKDVSKEIESDATPLEVLFVLKTPFFAKKIQKQEILAFYKSLFSLKQEK
jgi:hypothetical protein